MAMFTYGIYSSTYFMLAVLQVFYACVVAQPGEICLMLIMQCISMSAYAYVS